MAIGRISGSVLKSNLTRNGVDLAFETNLLYLDVTNNRVGIGTSEPNTTLHVNGNTTITGDLNVSGSVNFETSALTINTLNTGAILVEDNNIAGYRSNEDIVISAAGTGRIVLKNTIVANTIESDDSTAIQINDGVNISGTLNAKTLITNTIGSEDSTVIQFNDGVKVIGSTVLQGSFAFDDGTFTRSLTGAALTANRTISFPDANGTVIIEDVDTGNTVIGGWTINGTTVSSNDSSLITINDSVDIIGTLTTPTIQTNNISSADSSAIQINDAVNVSGTLTANTIQTNELSSTESTAIQVNDSLNASGTITAAGFVTHGTSGNITGVNNIELNQISSNDSTAVQVADGMNVSGTLTAPTFVTNDISSGDSTAIQVADGMNVSGILTASGGFIANGLTYPVTDGSANQVLTTNGAGQLSFTSLSSFTGITFVGDDSTGSTINTAETFKIIGGSNITTAVSGDTLTINGSNPAQGITFIGDDSAGTAIADGGTLQIVGSGSVDTSISGNVLTITSSIDSLNTGGLLIDDNEITGQRSNEDIEISTSGTGVITTNASIIPTTDDTVDLGSLTKRFKTGYFGSGTVYIGDQTISSSKTGLIFSGRVNTPSSMLDEDAKIISKIGIDTSDQTVNSFAAANNRAILYYQVYRDEVNEKITASKINVVHDGLEAYMSESAVVSTGTIVPGNEHTSRVILIGDNVLYKIQGNSAINSMQAYKTILRDNTGLKSAGRTSTLKYDNLSTAESVIDTWSISEYRSAKYFVTVADQGGAFPSDYLNAEISMVHDGTDAHVTTYNILSSSDESFITFTADISEGVARLKASSYGGTLNLKLHKLVLSDDESSDETVFQKIIGTATASSASTTIDSFHMTDTTAAFYTISAHDSNNTQSSISEVIVVHDEFDPYILIGPQLTTDGTTHLTFSVEQRGNQVVLKAAGSEAEIKISGYKISLYRPPAGNSNASLSAQGITIVGDDSSGTRIADNETVKIAGGAGITTSMVGDTLTITATGSAESTAEGLTFVGDDSTGTRISDGETVKITGAGGITTTMSGDTLTINGPTAFTFSVAGDDSTQRAISTGNTIKFVGSNGITTATDAEGNVTISGTTLVTLNIDAAGSAVVYDIAALNLDGGSAASTYGAGETSVNGGGA
jgi:hypothetical protein